MGSKAEETVAAINLMNLRPGEQYVDKLRKLLDGASTKTGGRLAAENIDVAESGVVQLSFEPAHRTRLDHYGNGGDGWDDDGWHRDYANPLEEEVESLIAKACASLHVAEAVRKATHVEIGEKGHVYITVRVRS